MKSYKDITGRYLKVQKKRTLLTMLGIVLSVALLTAIGTMIVSTRETLVADAISSNGDYHVSFGSVPGDKVNKIRNNVQVKNSATTCEVGFASVGDVSDKERKANPDAPSFRKLEITGYDQNALNMFKIDMKEGRLPKAENEIAVEGWVLDRLQGNPKTGDKIKLPMGKGKTPDIKEAGKASGGNSDETFSKLEDREYVVTGILKPKFEESDQYYSRAVAWMDKNKESSGNGAFNVYVKFAKLKDAKLQADGLAKSAALEKVRMEQGNEQYDVKFNEDLLRLEGKGTDKDMRNSTVYTLGFILILVMTATVAVIYNSFNISVMERISQFGVLRCVGATPAQIKRIVLREAGMMSAVSIPIGLGCGVLAMKIVWYFIEAFKLMEVLNMKIVISPVVFATCTVLGLLTVYLSALGPARRAGKVSPLEAVRNSGNYKKEKFKKVKKARLQKRLFGFEGQVAYKNLRRNRKRFAITVFSMVISIVLYIVFGSLMNISKQMGVINENELGDFNVRTRTVEGFKAQDYRKFKDNDDVDKVFMEMKANMDVITEDEKFTPEFKAVASSDFKTKDGKPVLVNSRLVSYGEDSWDDVKKNLKSGNVDVNAMNKENGVIVVNVNQIIKDNKVHLVDALKLKVGDEIEVVETDLNKLKDENSKDLPVKKVKVMGIMNQGILNDKYAYGLTMITTDSVVRKFNENSTCKNMLIRMKKDASKDGVVQELQKMKDENSQVSYVDFSKMAENQKKGEITMSIFIYGFIAVITLIGCLNIINTISTNLILRKKELSMMKAVGMTKGSIRKMVCLEGIYYGLIASVYGGIIGTALAYVLFKLMMGIREVPWTMPWTNIIVAVFGATAVALLAGYVPMKKINDGNIIENIRMEE